MSAVSQFHFAAGGRAGEGGAWLASVGVLATVHHHAID